MVLFLKRLGQGRYALGRLLLWPLRKETGVRLSESVLKQNQKQLRICSESQKKSSSLLGKDIIRDQRALRKLQRSLNVHASEGSEQFSISV